jgi:hypothetical protein
MIRCRRSKPPRPPVLLRTQVWIPIMVIIPRAPIRPGFIRRPMRRRDKPQLQVPTEARPRVVPPAPTQVRVPRLPQREPCPPLPKARLRLPARMAARPPVDRPARTPVRALRLPRRKRHPRFPSLWPPPPAPMQVRPPHPLPVPIPAPVPLPRLRPVRRPERQAPQTGQPQRPLKSIQQAKARDGSLSAKTRARKFY